MDVWAAFLVALFLGLHPAPVFTAAPPEDVARAAAIHARGEGRLRFDDLVLSPLEGGVALSSLEIDAPDLQARATRFFVSSAVDAGVAIYRVEVEDFVAALLNGAGAAALRAVDLDELSGDAWLEIAFDAASSSLTLRLDVELRGVARAATVLRLIDMRPGSAQGWRYDQYAELVREEANLDQAAVVLDAIAARLSSALARQIPELPLHIGDGALKADGVAGSIAEIRIEVEDLGGVADALEALTQGDPSDVARRAAAERLVGAAVDWLLTGAARGAGEASGVAETKAALAAELAAFLAEPGRARLAVAPTQPIPIANLSAALRDRAAMNQLLERLRIAAAAPMREIQPVSSAALKAATVDGYGVRPIAALELAEALLSGVGAPRNLDRALDLARGPAQNGDPQGLRIVAEALRQRGDAPEAAYEAAIRAAALGARTEALADEIEVDLRLETLLDAQRAASDAPVSEEIAWLTEDAVAGAPTAMRRLAQQYHRGRGAARNLSEAFYWASLAAAAGDAAGLSLRDRLARRFERRAPDEQALWRESLRDAEARALQTWIREGLGDRLAGE